MMTNRSLLISTPTNSLNSLDQVLDQREKNKSQEVEIRDSLIQEYNLNLFDGENTDIGVADYATHLFYDNASLENTLSQAQTETLFTTELNYHQSNVSSTKLSVAFIFAWLVMIAIICMLIIKIIRRRKAYAKKSRDRIQTAQLYY